MNAAGAVDALGHFEGERARHIGFGIRRNKVERLDSTALAQHQNIRVTGGGQECRFRRVSGNDGVDGMGGAVDQHIALRQQIGQRQFHIDGRQRQRHRAPP